MSPLRPILSTPASDAELVHQLGAGRQEALGELYGRYAPLVFNLARQSLDRATAEEIVQDVFLVVWRQAARFDPEQGDFRPWLLRLAHWRILNELRRRSRRPRADQEPAGERLEGLPDPEPEPADVAWQEERRAAVRAALDALPPAQRQALGLAFLEDLTHEQVARVLRLPLGTAKTRIRAGLQTLRVRLAPLAAALVLGALVGALGVRAYREGQAALQRDERALDLVTASDVVPLRLAAGPGTPEAAHGTYRGRPGTAIAVLTVSAIPPAPIGRTYQAWVGHEGQWTSLGTVQPDATGHGRLIAEGAAVSVPPAAVEVTLEPSGGSAAPTGPVVLAWPGT